MTTINDIPAGTWNVDPLHSELSFTARHLMVSKVRGRFTDFNGVVTVGERLEDSHVEAVAQAASIDTNSTDRDAHLRSGDFLDVSAYPQVRFVSTRVTPERLEGELTIRDTTRPVSFDLSFAGVRTDPFGNTKAGFEAETDVNRTEWGLTWNAALEGGGVLVSEKVKLSLDIQLVKA